MSYARLGEITSETTSLACFLENHLAFLPRPGDSADPLISGTAQLGIVRSNFYSDPDLNTRNEFGSDVGPVSGFVQEEPGVFGEVIGGEYGWRQSMYIPYVPELSGYNLNMFAFAGTESFHDGSAGVDSWNTITLDNVTYVDGSAIRGAISFDSGYTLTAVPEPSCLALIFLAGAARLYLTRPAAQ